MPALQTLLSKGEREPLRGEFVDILCAHFGVETAPAPLAALGEGVTVDGGWWLCADPVHLVADRDQLFLSASDALGLNPQEADALVAELNRTYAEDGWHFIAATPQHWYLRLPEAVKLDTISTAAAMGRRVAEVLPGGQDAMRWQRVMTEVQMLLHSSSINLQRTAQGQLAVNALWFWGGGALPRSVDAPQWDSVVGEHPMARGLAKLADVPVQSSVLSATSGRVLWVADKLVPEMDETHFAPLLSMLKTAQLAELALELPGCGRWSISRKELRRWWRRRKPLSRLLQEGK